MLNSPEVTAAKALSRMFRVAGLRSRLSREKGGKGCAIVFDDGFEGFESKLESVLRSAKREKLRARHKVFRRAPAGTVCE